MKHNTFTRKIRLLQFNIFSMFGPDADHEIPDQTTVENTKRCETPLFGKNGRLIKRPPSRHRLPRHNYYFDQSENKTSLKRSEAKEIIEKDLKEVQELKVQGKGLLDCNQNESPVGLGNIFLEKHWVRSPIPGIHVCKEHEGKRNEILKKYQRIYGPSRGVIPKYMGYVPGIKYRFGGTIHDLSYNAREEGFKRTRTWAGTVSLF